METINPCSQFGLKVNEIPKRTFITNSHQPLIGSAHIFRAQKMLWKTFSEDKLSLKIGVNPNPLQCFQLSPTLQRQNAENLKQIFPEKEYCSLSLNFHIYVSVSELCILTMGLPFLLKEICGPMLGIYKSLTDT